MMMSKKNGFGKTPNGMFLDDRLNEADRPKVSYLYSSLREKIHKMNKLELDKDMYESIYNGILHHFIGCAKARKIEPSMTSRVINLIKTELKLARNQYFTQRKWRT